MPWDNFGEHQLTSTSAGFCSSPLSGLAATMATRHTVVNISFAGLSARIVPVSNRFDCSQLTFFPIRLKEKVIRAAIPALANVRPVMKT